MITLTVQTGGWASPTFTEVAVEWDLLAVRTVARKEEADCLLPCVLKGGKVNVTRSGRRRVTDADAGTALVYDLDHGDLDAGTVERALVRLKVASAFWATWQSGPAGLRWRVLVPLATPVAVAEYEALWVAWARALEAAIAREVGERREGGWIDWQARSVTQPAILPCRPPDGSTGSPAYPWGGRVPSVVHVEGEVLVPGTKPPGRSSGAPRTFESKARPLTPYLPSSTTQRAREAAALLAKGTFVTPPPLAALDGVAFLREHGVRAERGGRHATVSSVIWTLYRLGAEPDEWVAAAEEMIASTGNAADRRHVERLAPRLVAYHDRVAAAAEPAVGELRRAVGDVPRPQRPALVRYCRVLARAAHLRRAEGGKLDHGALARIVGLDVRVLTAWRQKMTAAGLVHEWGTEQARRYRVLVGVEGIDALLDRELEEVPCAAK